MSQSSDSELYERDSQSQFVSQEGDEDVLWEVIEITAEKSKFYKVRWAGFDPKTNKPWAQSWVPKSDCTDDLVHDWKRRKLKKRKNGSKGSRLSHASLLSDISRVSANLSSTVAKPSAQDQNALIPINIAKSNGKRARSTALSDEEHEEHDVTQTKKKRKTTADDSKVAKADTNTGRKKAHVRKPNDETVNEPEIMTNRQRDKAKSEVLPMKSREEESSSDDEGTARIQPASSTSRSPSTVGRNVKLRRSSNTRTSTVTSDQDTAYVKFKSGKLSTPKKKPRRKKSAEDFTSSSDEVEEVVQAHKAPLPLPTKRNDSLPTTSSPTLRQLQAYHSPSPTDSHNDEDQLVQEMYDEYVDFDAAHQQPNKSIRASTTSNGAKDDSYRQGEVPETETESSHNTQSQSQSQPTVPPPKQRQPTRGKPASSPEHPKSSPTVKQREPLKPSRVPTLILPPHTPPRSSLISRMRPRTPGSSFLLDTSPVFDQPELELHVDVEEERDEAVTTTKQQKPASTTSNRGTSKAGSGPLRPIPRLSPSVFMSHLPSEPSPSIRRSRTDPVPAEESDEAEVVELVSSIEQFTSPEKSERKRKIAQDKADRKGKGKRPANGHTDSEGSVTDDNEGAGDQLEDVVRQRGEQLAARARAKRQREFNGTIGAVRKKTLIEVLSENEERKGKRRGREHEARNVKHEPEQRLKRNKSRSSSASSEDAEHESVDEDDIMGLREEEEESTQDLIMDLPDVPMEGVEQNQVRDVESSGQVTQEIESPEPPPKLVIAKEKNGGTRARSKSKSSSHSVRSKHRIPSQDELILPPTAPVPTSTPIESQEQDTGPDFVATLALLNEKSQENAQLMKEINILRAAASAPRPRELELERELEVLRASVEALQVSLAASEKRAADLARGKESAEKDREFFREHYAKASGFVASVQEENAELQKEAQIAKEQASTGVDAVKATYVARVRALEDDARTYKRLAMFIMEKDVRTNDEIRRKAAEEPELRARCDELGEELRGLRNEFVDLQEDVEDKTMRTEELEQELESWKRQATFLNADLCQVKSLHEGVDKVYECSWRVDDDVNAFCHQIFTTYEEFEQHMFSEQHLDAKRLGR